MINGICRTKFEKLYDPNTAPINDFENRFLVCFLQKISDSINNKVGFSIPLCFLPFKVVTYQLWIQVQNEDSASIQAKRFYRPFVPHLVVRATRRQKQNSNKIQSNKRRSFLESQTDCRLSLYYLFFCFFSYFQSFYQIIKLTMPLAHFVFWLYLCTFKVFFFICKTKTTPKLNGILF